MCRQQCTIGRIPQQVEPSTTRVAVNSLVLYPGAGIRLFCWSLAQPGYERDILVKQRQLSSGIFACDDHAVLGFFPWGAAERGSHAMEVVIIEQEAVGVSKDGTAANSLQFMRAWEAVLQEGRYERSDWTVKADPDAVLLPERLRPHLNTYMGQKVYVKTCNKPMTEGAMMFGAVEAVTRRAMDEYRAGSTRCQEEVPWLTWGEDLYLMRCLEHLGVGAVDEFDMVQDGVCEGVSCASPTAAAFHPMKSVAEWEACWQQATSVR